MGLFGRLTIGNLTSFEARKAAPKTFQRFQVSQGEWIDWQFTAGASWRNSSHWAPKMEKFDSCKQTQHNKQGRKRFMLRRQVNFHLSNCSVLIFLSSWPSSSFLGCFLKKKISQFPPYSPPGGQRSRNINRHEHKLSKKLISFWYLELLVALWETGGQS